MNVILIVKDASAAAACSHRLRNSSFNPFASEVHISDDFEEISSDRVIF